MALPSHVKYVIIGAGIHGLSTAWHLGENLRKSGKGSGKDILVIDKTGIAAGASGIACGVVRNNYFQPAMRRLMAHSVSVWESDPEAFSYHPVGYMQISPEVMHEDVAAIYKQQKEIGYPSTFIEGEKDCMNYMQGLFYDWQAKGITSVLHEKKGGYANNTRSIYGLAKKAENEDVRIATGIKVTGFEKDASRRRDGGRDRPGQDRLRPGHRRRRPLGQADLGHAGAAQGHLDQGPRRQDAPQRADVDLLVPAGRHARRRSQAAAHQRRQDAAGHPRRHRRAARIRRRRLADHRQAVGHLLQAGLQFRRRAGRRDAVQGQDRAEEVEVDPYGPESPDFIVGDDFAHMWVSALAFCQKRFEGTMPKYKKEPSGGIGCFTADRFPVFDRFCENVYVIADTNHGYKMIGVGKLVADDICGNESELLRPFRFCRFAEGKLHPASHSPFPWS